MNQNADDKNPSLTIVRVFAVAPEIIFDTFTKPEAMSVWWDDTTTFDIDLKVGGCWTIVRKAGDTIYKAHGEYMEIERPHHLRYTYLMPQFSPNSDIITIDIAENRKSGCQLTFTQSGEDIAQEINELSPGSISGSEMGWQQAFDLIAAAYEKEA